jgi:hypothetical protein
VQPLRLFGISGRSATSVKGLTVSTAKVMTRVQHSPANFAAMRIRITR